MIRIIDWRMAQCRARCDVPFQHTWVSPDDVFTLNPDIGHCCYWRHANLELFERRTGACGVFLGYYFGRREAANNV
jgi:hypothetical protein